MQNKPLHIISFDNPYPPDYGGVIDVFYKIKSLHALGFSIYLHCFYDERKEVSAALQAITQEVYLYKKNRNPFFLFSSVPFGIKSRFDKRMLQNIQTIKAPILFEGLQTTMLLKKMDCQYGKYLRLHNLESNFYAGMYRSESNLLRKVLYYFEIGKYKQYERQLEHFDHVITLSVYENDIVKTWADKVSYIPVFHGNTIPKPLSEQGEYALYHGDLRLPDNRKAAAFLIDVFRQIPDYKLIIASSNGEAFVKSRLHNVTNIAFVTLDNETQLDALLAGAHINVMLSFQKSGTKLKLINALFKSRYCLINENMIDDTAILQLCERASTIEEFVAKVTALKNQPYTDNERRAAVLSEVLDDTVNAQKIATLI